MLGRPVLSQVCSRQRAIDMASEIYARSGEPLCCDPRDIAESVGLRPCPTSVSRAFVRDGMLFYPDHMNREQRGPGIYQALASRILRGTSGMALDQLTRELIVPEMAAMGSTLEEIGAIQPNAPRDMVRGIFLSHFDAPASVRHRI